jgi:hypothetical protein
VTDNGKVCAVLDWSTGPSTHKGYWKRARQSPLTLTWTPHGRNDIVGRVLAFLDLL